ncbi:hypothetical protein AAG570_001006 [Ranatra chinensis]|uniref:Uncharacterized protein n=1 Tax=Ranatra chinensis TaxID=642074 RepID=A0ABD0YMD2_9HEMI
MVLSDMGAEVYKVESPGSGDECRNWPPNIDDSISCYFACLNRNKKSICVNLKSEKGREIIFNLAEICDVLVENFVPGKMDKLGLGYEKVRELAPHLIYCSISGYGEKGPYRNRPGFDVIAASVGGLINITGAQGGEPCKTGVALIDIATGLYAHGAILAALLERAKTGLGQKIDCNLLSTQISCLINIGANYLNMGKEAVRWGTAHESIVPYEAFETSDGYITVGAGSNAHFVDLCRRLKIPKIANDERFRTNPLRVKNREVLVDLLKVKMREKSTADWMEIFEGASFPCGPVNTLKQVFNDPHVKEIGLVEEVTLGSGKKLKVVGPPVTYSSLDNRLRSPPPAVGEHTKYILSSVLNYSEDQIQRLYKNNDVQ